MSKLDVNSGYWQLPIDEESQLKVTFITPFGRFCPTRSPFGLASMPDIFTKRMDKIFCDVDGVVRSMDDFFVGGKDEIEHDKNMREVLRLCRKNGLTLNLKKCFFRQPKVEFLGHMVSADGVLPLKRRIEAIEGFKGARKFNRIKEFSGNGTANV